MRPKRDRGIVHHEHYQPPFGTSGRRDIRTDNTGPGTARRVRGGRVEFGYGYDSLAAAILEYFEIVRSEAPNRLPQAVEDGYIDLDDLNARAEPGRLGLIRRTKRAQEAECCRETGEVKARHLHP
jgi:hypothetical protein